MEVEDKLDFDEDENINYFHKLEKDKKESYLKEIQKVNEINELNMPLKFKILMYLIKNCTILPSIRISS